MRRKSSLLSGISLELGKVKTEDDIDEVNASKFSIVEEHTTTRSLHRPSDQTEALHWRDSGHSTLVAVDAATPNNSNQAH